MMIIYADIRPLIVTGIVLFLTNFGWNYPLPLKRKLQVPGKRMTMTKKSCQDPIGNKGTCMFKYDCIRQKGVTLSTCVDGFLFGACCFIKEDSIKILSDDIYSTPTQLTNFNESNTTLNFYQLELEASLNNSKEYYHSVEEIFRTSFSPSSIENSHNFSSTSPLALFYNNESKPSTTYLSESEKIFTNVVRLFNKQLYNNDAEISSENTTNISMSSIFETTFLTKPMDQKEKPVIYNNTLSLDSFLQTDISINSTNDHPMSLSLTNDYTITSFESSGKTQFKENINQPTTSSSFDDISKENNITDIIHYFDSEIEEEKENSTELNTHVISKLNSTQTFLNVHEPYIPYTPISAQNFFELNETEESSKVNLSVALQDTRFQTSESTVKYMVSPLDNGILFVPEDETTQFYNTTHRSLIQNVNTTNKIFITESAENTTVLSTFQTPTITTNLVLTDHEIISIANSASQNYPELNEFEEKELLNTNTTSTHLNPIESTIADYKPSKSDNESTMIFISKSSNSSKTLDDKKTTKAMLLPTLPWSSNSVLPESFQSVLSQLIEQKISSPGNFILDSEAQATSEIDLNTLMDQNIFPDSEESVKLEFKSQNTSEFFNGESDENGNFYLSEFIQPSEANSLETYSFSSTPSNPSSIGQFDDKFDNINKNTIPTSIIPIKEFTKSEENTKVTENPEIDASSKYKPGIISDEYNTVETSQTLENFIFAPEEKPLVLISASSLDYSTAESDTYTKLLETDIDPYEEKSLISVQTESSTLPNTTFQVINKQEKINTTLSPLQMPNQSISVIETSSPTVQTQLFDSKKHNGTKLSTTLNKETTTDSHPTIIQIINNHTGKNLSEFNFSNKINYADDFFVNTVFTHSETTEKTKVNNMYPIVNNSLENSNNLNETEIFTTTSTQIILDIDNFVENQHVESSMHPAVSTDTSNYFNESLDSSHSTSFENNSSYINFNSTNMFSSILIGNSTSPFTEIVQNGTTDMESLLIDFEEQNFTHINESPIESADDSYNLIVTEDEHLIGVENYSEGSSYHPKTETKLSHNIDESPSDQSFGLQITTELNYVKMSIFTTDNVSTSGTDLPPTIQDKVTFTDFENSTLSISLEHDLNASDVSITTSAMKTVSSNAFLTQNIDYQTHSDGISNTSHEYSVIPSIENTTLSALLTSESSNIQDGETENIHELTSLEMQTYSSSVPSMTTQKIDIHRWNYKKDCGVRLMQPVGRIVGGKNTYFGKWPWQALVKEATWLGLFVKNKCGGVLITSKYVLTAAHCQPGFLATLLVVLGTHDLAETFDNKASIIRNVKRMVVHRHYNAQTFENDLALLEMEASVEFLPYVVPICLPHRDEDFTGKMAFVTGWGKLTAGGDVPSILQEVQVPIVTNGECQSMFYQAGHDKSIRSNFVCAGYTNGGQDSCEGDSGGPLMVQREDARWVLIGTVSHGIGCADPNLPGVYMRMSSYRPWIDSIIYK